ncbi:MAG: hypothetical protein A2Z16_15530 [Chloroflexi bacterium RBG_16_54_18]|nr:MAG: hypothetical protein A2Z16_15530 [Chloroflexi bacterium RBG_16_54_18]
MLPKSMLLALSALALVSMACGITINWPVKEVEVGPLVTEDISISLPEGQGDVTQLEFAFGAGEFTLAAGAQDALVDGTATYNIRDLKPQVSVDNNNVRIETGDFEINGIPKISEEYKNVWNLKLGDIPMDLRINAGAYKGEFDLGGLKIESLRISDGAADVRLNFSEPNEAEMGTFRYSTGASHAELINLANANFDTMVFKGGAGDYTLDFSGELQRNATVTIDSGFSSVKLIVPEGVSARVFVDSGLANVDIGGEWEKSGNEYTLVGEGPRLTINVNIGAGSLTLRNR